MPGQYRQHYRPQDVPLRRRVRARQRQRAPRYPAVEQPALLQILNEKRKLAQRRNRGPLARLPLDVNLAGERVGNHRFCLATLYYWLLTRRVSRDQRSILCHALASEPIRQVCQPSTAGFRIKEGLKRQHPRATF